MKNQPLPPTKFLDQQLAKARHVEVIVTATGKKLYLFGDRDIRDAGTEMLRSAIHDLGPLTGRRPLNNLASA